MRNGLTSLEQVLVGVVILLAVVAGVESYGLYSATSPSTTRTVTLVGTSISVSTVTAEQTTTLVSTITSMATVITGRTTTLVSTITSTTTVTNTFTTTVSPASPNVSAAVVICVYAGNSETCTIQLTNSGSANTNAETCSMTYGGATTTGSIAGSPVSVATGALTSVICTVTAADPGAGASIVGSIAMSIGGPVPFSGTSNN